MNFIKSNGERYIKLLKYLFCVSILLLVVNMVYLQDNSIEVWKLSSVIIKSDVCERNYVSENEINYENTVISPKDIRKSDNNIFFIETTCCTKKSSENLTWAKTMILNIRAACCIESAAYSNKNSMVHIMYTCPINENIFKSTPREILQIFRYKNVKLVKINVFEYFNNTPVNDLLVQGQLDKSSFPLEHTSDILRLLTLWKYGGTYFDLDVICIRPIKTLGTNFAGFESKTSVANGIINFEASGLGFETLTSLLTFLRTNFDGNRWAFNGPILLTNTLLKRCANYSQDIQENLNCSGFTIYQPSVFYPIPWHRWLEYFNETSPTTWECINNAYTAHMWNKLSSKKKVVIGSKQPYEILASKYCQLTHSVTLKNHKEY